MEERKSKVDKETTYKIYIPKVGGVKEIQIERGGEKMRIKIFNIPEYKGVFLDNIYDELMEIRKEVYGKKCALCGKFYVGKGRQRYCSKECCAEVYSREKKKERGTLPHDPEALDRKAQEAKEKGMSYGQMKAKKYIEMLRENGNWAI